MLRPPPRKATIKWARGEASANLDRLALRFVGHFRVDGLVVDVDELGSRYRYWYRGLEVEFELPLSIYSGFRRFNKLRPRTPAADLRLEMPGREAVVVRSIQVSVLLEKNAHLAQLVRAEAERTPPFSTDVLAKAMNEPHSAAVAAMRALLRSARTFGRQSWLSMEFEDPEPDGVACLVDMNSGGTFPGTSRGRAEVFGWPTTLEPPYVPRISEVFGRVSRGIEPTISETLQADANHLSLNQGFGAALDTGGTDFRSAVVLSAMACETEAKELIRSMAPAERQSAARKELKRSQPISNFFGSTMDDYIGRSLEKELPLLYAATQKLFTLRNKIVHHGEFPDTEIARAAISAGTGAMDWLGIVRSGSRIEDQVQMMHEFDYIPKLGPYPPRDPNKSGRTVLLPALNDVRYHPRQREP